MGSLPTRGELVTCLFPPHTYFIHSYIPIPRQINPPLRISLSHSASPHSPVPSCPPAPLSTPPSLNSRLRHHLQSSPSSPDTFDNARRLPSPSTSPLRLLCDATQSQCLITTSSNPQHFPLPRAIQAFHPAVPRSCSSTLAIFFKRLDTFLECRKHCGTPLFEQQSQQPREHHLDGTDLTHWYPYRTRG